MEILLCILLVGLFVDKILMASASLWKNLPDECDDSCETVRVAIAYHNDPSTCDLRATIQEMQGTDRINHHHMTLK